MLLLASLVFWGLVIVGGGTITVSFIGAIFDCDSFGEALGATAMIAALGLLVWAFAWSGNYLSHHHVWPWN